VTEDGVTASGYGAENAWEVRAVRYSLVGDDVIPSNAKNASLARQVLQSVAVCMAKNRAGSGNIYIFFMTCH